MYSKIDYVFAYRIDYVIVHRKDYDIVYRIYYVYRLRLCSVPIQF